MKVCAYVIFKIGSTRNNNTLCAVTLNYQTAIDYVLANTNNKIKGVKINEEWYYDRSENLVRQPCDEIKIFGESCGGYYYNGFLIKAIEAIWKKYTKYRVRS